MDYKGFTLLFGPKFLKAWRVYRLFKNVGKRRVVINNKIALYCPVESEERCVCVWQLNVDGCIWIGKGGGGGKGGEGRGGGKEHERSRKKKEARVGWVKRRI